MVTVDEAGGAVVKKWLPRLVVAALLVILIVQFVQEEPKKAPAQEPRTMQATDFTLPTVDGELSLHDQRGKVVILNFWASWCIPCQTEMPHFQKFYDAHQDDVEIVAVNYTKKDDRDEAVQFARDHNLTFPILFDETGEVSEMYGAFTIPTTYILNRDGDIVHQFAGPLDVEMLREYVGILF